MGFTPRIAAGGIELHGAVEDTVVGDTHGLHAQLPCSMRQPLQAAEAIQQGVLRVDVEMCKGHGLAYSDTSKTV